MYFIAYFILLLQFFIFTLNFKYNQQKKIAQGVPFAEPPVGDLRFRPLQPKKSWRGAAYNATEYAPSCLSPPSKNNRAQKRRLLREDCMYMNIWADARCRDESV
jgi:para-nitrobenzyl esterase